MCPSLYDTTVLRSIYLFSRVITWFPLKLNPERKENEPVIFTVLLESNEVPLDDFLFLPGVPRVAKAPKAQAPNNNKMAIFLSAWDDM